MNRKEFIKSNLIYLGGSAFCLNEVPFHYNYCNPYFWQLLRRFGESLLIDLAVDYAKPLIKNIFSSEPHKSLERQGYKHYSEVPFYSNSEKSLLAYTMIKQNKKGDIISSQTPFVVSNPNKIDTAVIFREIELATMVEATNELLTGSNTIQDVRKIILPTKVSARDWENGDGAVVFFTETGKISIFYEKNSDGITNSTIEIRPNSEVKNSNEITQKSHSFKFQIMT